MTITAEAGKTTTRLPALDALRGFDMFWLIGGELLPAALLALTGWPIWHRLGAQFQHSTWHGVTFYDLIFPLFIFIAGVALGLQSRQLASVPLATRWPHYWQAVRRLALLMLLGVIYNHGWGSGLPFDFSSIRYASVLGRIGIAWFVTAMIVWHCAVTAQRWLCGLMLVAYSMIQMLWPLTDTASLNALIDRSLLPGKTYRDAAYDPEGIYSHGGAIVLCLFGALIGQYWRQQAITMKRVTWLFIIAAALVLAGWLIHPLYPINKPLWTGSFTLISAGTSLFLLLAFVWLLGQGIPRWSMPLHWLGNNAILAYLGTSLVAWAYTVRSIFGGVLQATPANWRPLLFVCVLLGVQLWLLRWLYQHKWFLRV